MRNWSIILAATLLIGSAATAAGLVKVSQKGRAFSTGNVELGAGDVIRVQNEDSFLHQLYIQAARMSFESPEQAPGQDVDIRFSNTGSFEVRCHIHPKMLLRVNVH